MPNGYPDRKTAEQIWESGIAYRHQHYGLFVHEHIYRFHSQGVANIAERIAAQTVYLNPEKAYVLGLLHDYGKKNPERKIDYFHGLCGYNEMLELGYPEVARICLTHSFHSHKISDEDTNYPSHWLDQVREVIKDLSFDDYDKLIQICDMFVEEQNIVTYEYRIAGITSRYGMSEEQRQNLLSRVEPIKDYFDQKCGLDIYTLFNPLKL